MCFSCAYVSASVTSSTRPISLMALVNVNALRSTISEGSSDPYAIYGNELLEMAIQFPQIQ